MVGGSERLFTRVGGIRRSTDELALGRSGRHATVDLARERAPQLDYAAHLTVGVSVQRSGHELRPMFGTHRIDASLYSEVEVLLAAAENRDDHREQIELQFVDRIVCDQAEAVTPNRGGDSEIRTIVLELEHLAELGPGITPGGAGIQLQVDQAEVANVHQLLEADALIGLGAAGEPQLLSCLLGWEHDLGLEMRAMVDVQQKLLSREAGGLTPLFLTRSYCPRLVKPLAVYIYSVTYRDHRCLSAC